MSFIYIKSEELVLIARLNKGCEKLREQKLAISRHRMQTYITGALADKIVSELPWLIHFTCMLVTKLISRSGATRVGSLSYQISRYCLFSSTHLFGPPLQCKAQFTPQKKSQDPMYTPVKNVPEIALPLTFPACLLHYHSYSWTLFPLIVWHTASILWCNMMQIRCSAHFLKLNLPRSCPRLQWNWTC